MGASLQQVVTTPTGRNVEHLVWGVDGKVLGDWVASPGKTAGADQVAT